MDIKTVFDIVESGVKTAAIIVGACWTYWKFVIQRANEPSTDLDIDVRFVGKQDSKWIIEITVTLENKSQVQLKYEDFTVAVRYLLPRDEVNDGGVGVKYQINAPRTIDERIEQKGRDWRGREFANVAYINPKQVFHQRYITYIPGNATFVWIQTKFNFPQKKLQKKKLQKVNSQRIFGVPSEGDTSKTVVHGPALPAGNDQGAQGRQPAGG